jgi:hypothetical protein
VLAHYNLVIIWGIHVTVFIEKEKDHFAAAAAGICTQVARSIIADLLCSNPLHIIYVRTTVTDQYVAYGVVYSEKLWCVHGVSLLKPEEVKICLYEHQNIGMTGCVDLLASTWRSKHDSCSHPVTTITASISISQSARYAYIRATKQTTHYHFIPK